MYVTRKLSKHFDPDKVVDADNRGGVAWGQFNENFERLQTTPLSRLNEGTNHPLHIRLLRLLYAYVARRRDAIVDLAGKAAAIERLPVPENPDVVFFGAEVGWEAAIVRALFGDAGRLVLIDNDPLAYQRYLDAPTERTITVRGKPVAVRRDPDRTEYVREDFFDVSMPGEFDVGIDWGVIEHYEGDRKFDVMANFQSFLRPDGIEISSCPRNTRSVRNWYRLFRDEMNFGYRELHTLDEFVALLESGGFGVLEAVTTPAHNIAACRVLAHETAS